MSKAKTNPSLKIAVPASSAIAGLLIVWVAVRALAPHAAGPIIVVRYAIYAVMLAGLFWACDNSMYPLGPFPFSACFGPSAAAVTASSYLQVSGVPVLTILCVLSCFEFGFAVFSCLRISREELRVEIARQFIIFSLMLLIFTAIVLLAVLANIAFASRPMDAGFF